MTVNQDAQDVFLIHRRRPPDHIYHPSYRRHYIHYPALRPMEQAGWIVCRFLVCITIFLKFEDACDGFRSLVGSRNADNIYKRANNWGLWTREYGNPWTNWPNPERRRWRCGDRHGRGTSGKVGAAGDWYKIDDRSGEWAHGEAHGYDDMRGGLWILSGVFENIHIIFMLRTSVLFSSSPVLEIFSEPKESEILFLRRLGFKLRFSRLSSGSTVEQTDKAV